MTVQQLNQLADSLEAEGLSAASVEGPAGADAAFDPTAIMGKICGIYRKVKPFLDFLLSMWFVPAKWRTAILSFTGMLDMICPPPTE